MLDLNNFSVGYKKVQHSLENFWNWTEVNRIVQQNISLDPKYYRDLGEGGFTLGGIERVPYCKKVLDFLQSKKPEYYARAGMYVGTKLNSKSFPKHTDPGQYLWIWQIIGETKWLIEDGEILLKCGEVVYISPGLCHQAIPNIPRASITFSLEEYE